MKKILIVSLMTLAAHQAFADDQQATSTAVPSGLYVGAGLSYNDLDFGSIVNGADNETAMGIQGFVGLPIATSIEGFETFAELGFFRTDEFEFRGGQDEKVVGISGSAVIQRNLDEVDPNLYGLARIGIEFGDDDGIFMGIGAGYRITPKVEVRAEFVNKDLISSYQANALFRF